MTNAATLDGINVAYAMPSDQVGQSYPAIQATTYRPGTMSQSVYLCLSQDSFDLLSRESAELVGSGGTAACNYGEDDVTMMLLPESTRFILLGIPKMLKQNKETKDVDYLRRGDKLAGTDWVTATKLIMCLTVDNKLLLTDDGTPQIFTLKLTSSKTKLVSGDRNDREFKSVASMNAGLLKHYKQRRCTLTHLVSVPIIARPEKFSSRTKNESSIGILFTLGGSAHPLTEDTQTTMYHLINTDEVKDLLANPFMSEPKQSEEDEPSMTPVSSGNDPMDYDDIPF
ncbi:MAG: hypothetical protein AAFX78_10110 [Cyanobacteria bacterium J06638_20]